MFPSGESTGKMQTNNIKSILKIQNFFTNREKYGSCIRELYNLFQNKRNSHKNSTLFQKRLPLASNYNPISPE